MPSTRAAGGGGGPGGGGGGARVQDQSTRPVWLDCDPGHDDAMAILLAGHDSRLNLLGISTVGSNQRLEAVTENALRVTSFYGVDVPVIMGASKPMMRKSKHCGEIHGDSGLDGINGDHGLLPCAPARMEAWRARERPLKAVPEMYRSIRQHYEQFRERVTIIATGSMTNVALLLCVYGEDVCEALDGIVFMGGSVREGGNTGIVAEFNIQTDPEAAQIVVDAGIPVTMVPLDVTHKVLVTDEVIERIRAIRPNSDVISRTIDLLLFFRKTYSEVFGFDAPPLHDPLAVAYVIRPELFATEQLFVSIERNNVLSAGQTICDVHRITHNAPNVMVAHGVEVAEFWDLLCDALSRSVSEPAQ